MFAAGSLEQNKRKQKNQFDAKGDNSAAGSGQEQGTNRQESKKTDYETTFATDFSQHKGNQRNGDHELCESGEMVPVDVGTEGDPAIAHFAKPIEFAVESELLKNPEAGHQEREQHDKP